MVLDLFMRECMQQLFPIFIIWKKRTGMTYGACAFQFNKHPTNHNKGIVLLIELSNWRPRG